jgi:hypothetical protein
MIFSKHIEQENRTRKSNSLINIYTIKLLIIIGPGTRHPFPGLSTFSSNFWSIKARFHKKNDYGVSQMKKQLCNFISFDRKSFEMMLLSFK